MSDTVTCPECGEEVDSVEQLEEGHSVPEIEADEDGSITLFENKNLFLCQDCKNPLGMRK